MLLDMMVQREPYVYQNRWVLYSHVKSKAIDDITFKLKKAIDQDLVLFRNGYVRFVNNEVMNAAIRAIAL
jgi:hypothetical protein